MRSEPSVRAGRGEPWRRIRRRHPLAAFLAGRLALAVLLALVVSVLVFAAIQLLPGDAARAVLGGRATPEQLATVRADLNLDEPAVDRYAGWLGGVLRGDLGTSLTATGDLSVVELAKEPLVNTLVLGGVTLALLVPLAFALGTLAGLRRGGLVDHVISGTTLAGIAVPEFVLGSLLVLWFAVDLGWFPANSLIAPGDTPLVEPEILVLPVATLLIVGLAYTTRLVRAGVVEVSQAEFVQTARLSGLPERTVVTRYIVRNALPAAVQSVAQTTQWLLGGVVVVEAVFSFPGLGSVLVNAVADRDLPTVQSLVLCIALAFIVINAIADLVVVLLVPRLRTAAA